jgi:hypothetical protein
MSSKKYRENQMFSRLFSTDLATFSGTNSLQLLTDQDNLIHDKTFTLLRGLFGTIDILSRFLFYSLKSAQKT